MFVSSVTQTSWNNSAESEEPVGCQAEEIRLIMGCWDHPGLSRRPASCRPNLWRTTHPGVEKAHGVIYGKIWQKSLCITNYIYIIQQCIYECLWILRWSDMMIWPKRWWKVYVPELAQIVVKTETYGLWTMQIGKEIYCLRAQYTKNMFTSFHCLDLHLGRKLHAFTTAILPPKDSLMDHQCNPAVASTSTDANPPDNTVYMGQLALVPTYELSINQ